MMQSDCLILPVAAIRKTAVGSSVLARDQQGPVGQTPARQSYPQNMGDRRERCIWK